MFAAMAALPRRRAVRPGRVRRRGAAVRVRLRGRAGRAHRAVRARQPRRPGAAPLGLGLAGSTAIGVGLLVAAVVRRRRAAGRAVGDRARCSTSAGRSCSAPRAGGSCPRHFAERHGLIVIIALGRVDRRDRRRRRARASTRASSPRRCSGSAVAAALWWLYFDVVVAGRRRGASRTRRPAASRTRSRATPTPTCTSRWSPGSCSSRSGSRRRSGHVDEPLKLVPAVALLGGAALYLLAHVAFRWRNIHTLNRAAARRSRSCCVALIPRRDRGARARDAGDPRRRCSSRSSPTRPCASPTRASASGISPAGRCDPRGCAGRAARSRGRRAG